MTALMKRPVDSKVNGWGRGSRHSSYLDWKALVKLSASSAPSCCYEEHFSDTRTVALARCCKEQNREEHEHSVESVLYQWRMVIKLAIKHFNSHLYLMSNIVQKLKIFQFIYSVVVHVVHWNKCSSIPSNQYVVLDLIYHLAYCFLITFN